MTSHPLERRWGVGGKPLPRRWAPKPNMVGGAIGGHTGLGCDVYEDTRVLGG